MAKSIHPSLSCLLPFYTIPIFPLLNRKIFHLLASFLLFLDAHYILNLFYTLRNILPEAICCCFFMPCYCLMVYISGVGTTGAPRAGTPVKVLAGY